MSFTRARQQVLHCNGRHLLSPELIEALSAEGIDVLCAAADGSFEANAAAMLDSLKCLALNPLRNKEDFVVDQGASWLIYPDFDRLSHFVLPFSVPKSEAIAGQLLTHIRLNLRSQRYKAAAILRRQERRVARLGSQASTRAARAAREYVAARVTSTSTFQEREQAEAEAEQLFDRILRPRLQQLSDRWRALAAIANPGTHDKPYTLWVAETLGRVLPTLRQWAEA
ncbi:hypothetical protein [Rubrivivax gelatinosus]|uniref:hypothetical protein n=1 Tax=Rubrivivax gelatinosus TaxID=28068 RepID=UPI0005C23BBC|nr:hypothetical protein [Rubrivivax gelatinosus]MBG6083063.1 hypothetical protein [Rubrivivax gelatinosus]